MTANGRKWRVLASFDDNPKYALFLPTMVRMWKNFGAAVTLGFVTSRPESDPLIKFARSLAEVVLLRPAANLNSGNQAKMARTYVAQLYPDEVCTVVDVDLYVFCKEWLFNYMKCAAFSDLLGIGRNAYNGGEDEGKYPMYFSTALGQTFQQFSNPNRLEWQPWIEQLSKRKVLFHHKELMGQKLYVYSDESLYRALLSEWSRTWSPNTTLVTLVMRQDGKNERFRRVDRSRWGATDWAKVKNRNDEYYRDCFPIRPMLTKNGNWEAEYKRYQPIFARLDIGDDAKQQTFQLANLLFHKTA